MSMRRGITLNGKVCLMALTCSLITRICLSILGTCLFAAVKFSWMPILARSHQRGANSPSIKQVAMLKLHHLYSDVTFLVPWTSCWSLRNGMCSEVKNRMWSLMLAKNGTLFMKKGSVDNVMHLLAVKMLKGTEM